MTADWDVIVVGCGPVGAFGANLLGRAGLRVLVLDRDTAPYALPRAVHFDHEMMRLLADAGLPVPLQDRLLAADGHLHIGADRGVIRFLSAAGRPRPFGHANDYFFYQPELEEVLRAGLRRYPGVELRLGCEVAAVRDDTDRATVTLSTGEDLTARFVIGADGARSTVRKSLGIELDDLDFEEPWLVVDAEVDGPVSFPDLTGLPEGANLQRLSVMMCDPARPATIVPGRGNHRRWEFMLLPGESDAEISRPDTVAALVAPWVKGVPHRIIRAATYRFHGLVANRWRVGHVFLAGDAAHQTPPFFGQGMCHGLRDMANLAWKLALVLSGTAGDDLPDSYQAERDPQVRHVIGKAIEAGKYICVLDPEEARGRDMRVRAQRDIATAAELIAPIHSPIIGAGAGERFINPRVGQGVELLDSLTGGGWVLLSNESGPLDAPAETALRALGAHHLLIGRDVADAEGHLNDWFAARGVSHVLVRPDFYTALQADSLPALAEGLIALTAAMSLTTPPTTTQSEEKANALHQL